MNRRLVLTLVLLVVGICLAFAPAQAGDKATKTFALGSFWQTDELVAGDSWLSGHILHFRDYVYQWDSTATDWRVEGDYFNTFNANIDISPYLWSGQIWGKLWIEQDGVRVWEGNWNGKFVDGVQHGKAILHGVGVFDGLKVSMSFQEQPDYSFDFDAIILDPGGS